MADLYDNITVLPKIGQKKAALFAALGVRTVYDLLSYFPRAYEDRTHLCQIAALEPGAPACFAAMVVSEPRTSHIRTGLDLTRVQVADQTGRLTLTFFNQRFSAGTLRYGERYLFYGAMDGGFTGTGMLNPVFEPLAQSGTVTNCILPIYPLTAGLTNKTVLRTVQMAIDTCLADLPELLPGRVLTRYALCDVQTAYREIHMPSSFDALEIAKRRLIFEEFFVFSCGLSLLRARRVREHRDPMEHTDLRDFYAALPFALTGAQRRAIQEILGDFCRPQPMNRLLQGDVGSGKTMVAAAAIVSAAKNGLQSALMAPTEILAEQHYRTLLPLLGALGVSVCLLTGSLPAAAKRAVKESLASGDCSLVIGTHALISRDVRYRNLGLVVTDEQHRFGVSQRTALSEKGPSPHQLIMSATPIPRTLALILYGDLDVSLLDEKPAGRKDVDTFLVGEAMRPRINAFIRRQVSEGHQVFVVCPAVEDSEENDLKSVELWAETLQKTVFPDLRVGLLHGRMKGAEKDETMGAFAHGDFDILVATTVIEVGVDVPGATLMVIENADRFGLSQLHQLRGRVGRSSDQSYCVLFTSQKNAETLQRLKTFCQTNDGFRIAEADLSQRGPGDFFGSRQSGLPVFRVASLTEDLSALTEAKEAADDYLRQEGGFPDAEPLRNRIAALFSDVSGALN
ncbi:MAG: ATP-dependent DNA helicase RecG [Oscillospiraceae bacterium]|nr:ATP-dependent DNA helicase RecG [Oscillospiraceae bacterium]